MNARSDRFGDKFSSGERAPKSLKLPGRQVADTLTSLFEAQAKLVPSNIAVIFREAKMSYAELNDSANILAHHLLSMGVKKDQYIPVCLNRSPEMIITILGILKAGAAYVPVDAANPKDRIAHMVSDTGANILITSINLVGKFDKIYNSDIVCIDSLLESKNKNLGNPRIKRSETDLAYLIYTSGSTGKPKAVTVEHGSVVNLLNSQLKAYSIDRNERVLQTFNFAFDASVEQIFLPLVSGATMLIVPEESLLDANAIQDILSTHQITHFHSSPALLKHIKPGAYSKLKRVVSGGEACPISLAKSWSAYVDFYNEYGPTETTITSLVCKYTNEHKDLITVPIGKPVANTRLYILDVDGNKVKDGDEGELWIAGKGVARGYLNSPELTAAKFCDEKFSDIPGTKMYCTGDLVKAGSDGTFHFLGRIDQQVKIRGYRVEIAEIESVLNNFPGINGSVVTTNPDANGDQQLVAHIMVKEQLNNKEINRFLEQNLPGYMLPSAIYHLDQIPVNKNGKVDRKALAKIAVKKIKTVQSVPDPGCTALELKLTGIWKQFLNVDEISIDDNFFESGGNSLLALSTIAQVNTHTGYSCTTTKFYKHPTIRKLASYLSANVSEISTPCKLAQTVAKSDTDVAVIGMAGKFPGADNITALWKLLIEGKESIRFFSEGELDPSIAVEVKNNNRYVKARGVINSPESFDADFFGISPKMAKLMDPQHRIFLEIAWEVLETSGYGQTKPDTSIGVFAGCSNNSYYLNNIHGNTDLQTNAGNFQMVTVCDKDYIASRVAYALNLRGPAINVQSACSTSLLAITQAVESIRAGKCDMAIAGGASITVPVNSGHLYEEGAILSSDGHCRPFDNNATGTVFSDGAGVVLLKSKVKALEDGDLIYAVIKGIGISNDGSDKGSFSAPSSDGQSAAVTMAIADAGISSASISYIEAHGTGTPIGDPIEIEGLKKSFGQQDKTQFCAIGSIKSNIGHLTAAAGVAGFIKTVLALHHKIIPATLFFNNANQEIDFKSSPFYVNHETREWKSLTPAIAGVSSFGVGGTNVHVILQQAEPAPSTDIKERAAEIFCWSAKTVESRDAYAEKLKAFILEEESVQFAAVAYNLNSYRKDFSDRRFIVASDKQDLLAKLSRPVGFSHQAKQIKDPATSVTFMFPGQGSQFAGMGKELYEHEPAFRKAVDECSTILDLTFSEGFLEVLFPLENNHETASRLNNTYYTQPALFVIEYAEAKLWMSWGIKPSMLIGHSIGEFLAAHLAGIFNLEDALKLVVYRASLMSVLPAGHMLSVRMPFQELKKILPANLSVAAINGPEHCVVSGPKKLVTALAVKLQESSIASKLLTTSHAFHSSMMDPVIEPFENMLRSTRLSRPMIPLISTVTGTILTDEEATSASYWARHLRETVKFSEALSYISTYKSNILLEVGPGRVTYTLARQQVDNSILVLPGMDNTSVLEGMLKSLGQLWLNGITPDWKGFYSGRQLSRMNNLPAYAFNKKRYWIEPERNQAAIKESASNTKVPVPPEAADSLNDRNEISKSIYELLEETSGIDKSLFDDSSSFMELGLDSLLLTQVSLVVKKKFNVPVSFRQLNDNLNNISSLTEYIFKELPAKQFQQAVAIVNRVPASVESMSMNPLDRLSQQVEMLAAQLADLKINPGTINVEIPRQKIERTIPAYLETHDEEVADKNKPFGAAPKIDKQSSKIGDKQLRFLQNVIHRYNEKTSGSKAYNQHHRSHMADPRIVSGFKPHTKELVYSIVMNRSSGTKMWDVDNNEYLDVLNGFGSNLLGYQPDEITNAIIEQVHKGFEVGPQHELAGEVCKLVCEFTGFDRAALCSTGSEAVLGAMRIARTVTGRSLIVSFTGSYHGIMDEVIIRGNKKFNSFPAAPGIMPEAVQNMLVLDYGTDESLEIIRVKADQIAAILVEPVQSRRPDFQPFEFLKEIRKITKASGTALIFDEVITGFRMHSGGMQSIIGIKADIATYGKVIGGGLPIGVIAGNSMYMDALDGGQWDYGNDSKPETGVTYFAGTFVRHPLALAAAKATLNYLKVKGPSLQLELNRMTNILADDINSFCQRNNLPLKVLHYGSLWKIKINEDVQCGELLFTLMRLKGIHIWEQFPCFITDAFTDEDITTVFDTFRDSINEMIGAGIFSVSKQKNIMPAASRTDLEPPLPGARLGKDDKGNPGWFLPDPDRPGKFLQLKTSKKVIS